MILLSPQFLWTIIPSQALTILAELLFPFVYLLWIVLRYYLLEVQKTRLLYLMQSLEKVLKVLDTQFYSPVLSVISCQLKLGHTWNNHLWHIMYMCCYLFQYWMTSMYSWQLGVFPYGLVQLAIKVGKSDKISESFFDLSCFWFFITEPLPQSSNHNCICSHNASDWTTPCCPHLSFQMAHSGTSGPY